MATYAEGSFNAGGYEFDVKVTEGLCPNNVYVQVRASFAASYSNTASFVKHSIKNKSTTELELDIKTVARALAVIPHRNYRSAVENDPNFEDNFVKCLEPILAEGIDNFNGGKSDSRAQEIIAKLREK